MSAQIIYKQLLKITMILFIIQIWWRWWHYRTCNCSSWCYSRWCHHQMQVLSQKLQRKRSLLRKCRWTIVISLQNHMILKHCELGIENWQLDELIRCNLWSSRKQLEELIWTPMFMQNTLQNALNFCTDKKSKNHPTKMLELFQNNNTSMRCL